MISRCVHAPERAGGAVERHVALDEPIDEPHPRELVGAEAAGEEAALVVVPIELDRVGAGHLHRLESHG